MFGTPLQLRDTYGDLLLGQISTESNVIKANKNFFALPWAPAGSVCIVPHPRVGTVHEETPLVFNVNEEGDKVQINDFALDPFDLNLVAVAGTDGAVGVFRVPADGLTENLSAAQLRVTISTKRLLNIDWHPTVSGIVAVATSDKVLSLVDIENGGSEVAKLSDHGGLLTNWSFNYDGSLVATACKDKLLRIFDPRAGSKVAETKDHEGSKSAHVQWMGREDKIVTAGFTKSSERELALYDPRNLKGRLHTEKLENSSSALMLFADEDVNLLYVAGKGDGTIRYYEVGAEAPGLHYLNEFKAKTPQNGLSLLPKSLNNVMAVETARFLKLSGNRVEPIVFTVPRQQTTFFQDDLFPPTWDRQPTATAAEWLAGANNQRNLISLAPK